MPRYYIALHWCDHYDWSLSNDATVQSSYLPLCCCLSIGTMNFGDQLSKKKSFALLDQAVKEHAINFIVSTVICNHT